MSVLDWYLIGIFVFIGFVDGCPLLIFTLLVEVGCFSTIELTAVAPERAAKTAADAADLHLSVAGPRGHDEPLAHASLWWVNTPAFGNEKLGLIGHYFDRDERAAHVLLNACCAQLRAHGTSLAVGPMDGNTWRRYRLLSWRGDYPPFLLELDNPDNWPTHWLSSGFEEMQHYVSTRATNLAHRHRKLDTVVARLKRQGVSIRPLESSGGTAELRKIYTVAKTAFTQNVLYTPLAESDFVTMYQPAMPLLEPGLSLVAECDGVACGFLFALPDRAPDSGKPTTTVIIKTLARLPGRKFAGLGFWLLHKSQSAALAAGYNSAVHALMHVSNRSTVMGDSNELQRRYTLYQKRLE